MKCAYIYIYAKSYMHDILTMSHYHTLHYTTLYELSSYEIGLCYIHIAHHIMFYQKILLYITLSMLYHYIILHCITSSILYHHSIILYYIIKTYYMHVEPLKSGTSYPWVASIDVQSKTHAIDKSGIPTTAFWSNLSVTRQGKCRTFTESEIT